MPSNYPALSHCCICGRPLIDATSVEMGIGPICRGKAGLGSALPNHARVAMNLACGRILGARKGTSDELDAAIDEVAKTDVGEWYPRFVECLRTMAHAMRERREKSAKTRETAVPAWAPVRIVTKGDKTAVRVYFPYCKAAIDEARTLADRGGKNEDTEEYFWQFGASARLDVWNLLRRHFAGRPLIVDGNEPVLIEALPAPTDEGATA